MKMQTFAVSALALTLTAATFAQAPATPGGFGGGQGGGFAARQRGQAGGQRALPFAMGQVTAVNTQAGTITITPQFPQGAAAQTIQVAQSAPINAMTAATVADLKIGDQIAVSGMPTAMTAMQITVGEMPGAAGGARAAGGGFGGGQGGGNARAAGAGGRQPGTAQVSGKVTALSPLTISLSSEATLVLKVASDTKVSKIGTVGLNTVKVGDTVMAMGQAGADGTFAANSVNLNMPMGGGMMGMMGGGAGMRGMMGGGQGGFGGGQGGARRRNRGGAAAPAQGETPPQ